MDKQLERRITLVAVGGTALTLLRAKPSTIDADLMLPTEDYDEFQKALRIVPHGFTVHCFQGGMIFSQILPDDYLKKCTNIRKLKRIDLKALSPVDIVVTKIGRLDARDEQDIETCIRKFRLTRDQIAKRARQVQYVGREQNYETNLRHVLETLFGRSSRLGSREIS